ncbi:hypothetical protein [Phenylobacterium sp.]|uniref:SMODS domain-containing nucleotidyltransferase n=1 Tax=Phenylobacterium sp. TaxID=1871053 RepID=UPI002635C29E|nr:hypothetical protein [Phenylobacterium sp.]
MQLTPQFTAFLQEIRPTATQRGDWRTGSQTLRTRLLADPKLKDIVVTTFLQGSVRRSTAVRPLGDKRPDVDVVVVTRIDKDKVAPVEAMKLFTPFLDTHYKGKWTPQDRSFAIELSYVDIDLVITALPSDASVRQKLEELYRSQAVETAQTLEESQNWRLNRNWREHVTERSEELAQDRLLDAPSSEWAPNPLWLPDRAVMRWGRTHPLAQIRWTADKNRLCNGHYVNIVRALKWWRLEHQAELPKYPKGYPLEHMIGHVAADNTQSMAQGVVQAFEAIRDTWATLAAAGSKPRLQDHGVPEHDVLKRLAEKDFVAFHKAASAAAATARSALDETDPQKSAELWRQLFGSRFPWPPQGGGDRKGFTPPPGPADPKAERFA